MDDIDMAQERILKDNEALVRSRVRPVFTAPADEPRWCNYCGKIIPPQRLEAYPEALLCVKCQGRLEAKTSTR